MLLSRFLAEPFLFLFLFLCDEGADAEHIPIEEAMFDFENNGNYYELQHVQSKTIKWCKNVEVASIEDIDKYLIVTNNDKPQKFTVPILKRR